MSRVGVGGSRYDTQRKPSPAIGGEGKRRQLLVNENLSIAVENMEVGGDTNPCAHGQEYRYKRRTRLC